jgi:hypothetical protein
MGHTRLGKIPTTKAWREVVRAFTDAGHGREPLSYSAEVARIASSTMEAAAGAMRAARNDGGISHTFFLLTQLALAARRKELGDALAAIGIRLPKNASAFDLTIEVHRVVDEHFMRLGQKSDLAEMGQLALGETLASYFRSRPRDLFASAGDQLHSDLHALGGQSVFGEVSRKFFANLMTRMLGFYLSKIVRPASDHKLVANVEGLTRFNEELKQHSFQRSLVVHEFAAKWFSKTEFQRGIDERNARRFVSYACKKIEIEFMRGAAGE